MEKVSIFENFSSSAPKKLGELYVENVRGTENYSFEYNEEYLSNNKFIMLDPEIYPVLGRQYPFSNKLFGLFQDCKPDNWTTT